MKVEIGDIKNDMQDMVFRLPFACRSVVRMLARKKLSGFLNDIKMQVDRTVAQLPSHQAYVEQYCRAADKPG